MFSGLGTRGAIATSICFAMAVLAWGTVFYGHSVYMDALMRQHGWSAALISSAILLFWMASLPGALCVGILVDRFGPAPVVAIGGGLIGCGLLVLARINTPWQLYVVYAMMGFGYPGLAAAAISATLAPWFQRGFGVALGIALTGASVGGALLPAMIVRNSTAVGFEATMTTAGSWVLAVIAVAVVSLALLGRPEAARSTSAVPPRFSMLAVLRRGRFWKIALAAAIGLGGQVGLLAHQVPMISMHLDHVTASLMVTVVAVASAAGRLLVGVFSRYLSISGLAAASYILHGAGIGLLALSTEVAGIIAACALAGLVVGAIVMLPPMLVREAFGTAGFGRTYAMVNVVMYILAGLSPWIVGMLRDASGSYSSGLWMLVVMEAVAAIILMWPSGRIARP